jgi:XRE family aerobic/anaerobic benzoate catabolism transcriptional regulator
VRASIDALLEGRTEAELREARAWLEARFAPPEGPIVALLGMRGAGKSTIGRRVAERLGLPFHELDHLIEEAAGLTLGEIFELHGEVYYRRLERETLAAYLARTQAGVLATGGSLVQDRESFRLLKRRALTVWLRARPEDHWNRVVQQGDQRPMAENPHAMQELRALLAARERLYAEAEHAVDTSQVSVDEAVDQVARLPRGR